MKPGATTLELWTRLEEVFHDYKHIRAVYLEKQFTDLELEHFTNISDYYNQIKLLADQLANVECPVSDRKMVMQMITGLPKGEYDTVATIISQAEPTPSFNQARSMFILEETRQKKQDDSGQHALVAQLPPAQPPVQPPLEHPQRGGGKGHGNGRAHNPKGKGHGKAQNSGVQQGPPSAAQHQTPSWGYGWPPIHPGNWASPPCPFPT